ncbi:hypothetical protein CDAR_567591 [Caerostris darwini]|uniref:Uncharacterized protein n=1 Tax=Caerostris darwini TaxID=1538125 RepID=A0AAV4QZT6_9ARAC|nr:hypothetical protein CDAR_567591 [Caerostris darwini]
MIRIVQVNAKNFNSSLHNGIVLYQTGRFETICARPPCGEEVFLFAHLGDSWKNSANKAGMREDPSENGRLSRKSGPPSGIIEYSPISRTGWRRWTARCHHSAEMANEGRRCIDPRESPHLRPSLPRNLPSWEGPNLPRLMKRFAPNEGKKRAQKRKQDTARGRSCQRLAAGNDQIYESPRGDCATRENNST